MFSNECDWLWASIVIHSYSMQRKETIFCSDQLGNVLLFFEDSPSVSIKGGGVITENERLVLTCDVDSYPPVDSYQWYKNNQKLNLSSTISAIQMSKVSKDDQGVYACLVKNTLKYPNGSIVEKFNQTQTTVTVQCKTLPKRASFSHCFVYRCAKNLDELSYSCCRLIRSKHHLHLFDRFSSFLDRLLVLSKSNPLQFQPILPARQFHHSPSASDSIFL